MYAVVKCGGKQYKISDTELFKVEKLEGNVGDTVELEAIMLVDGENIQIGTPTVVGSKIVCEIKKQDKERKVVVYKYKAKKNVRKRQGHRQPYTMLKVTSMGGK